MFGHSFEGQTRSRPSINLSGSAATPAVASTSASSTTPQAGPSGDSVAQRARQERAQREQQRKLDRTARVIQSFYRSRRQAGQTRDAVRQQYDRLAIGSPTTVLDPEQLLQATSLLAFILSPVANTTARKRRARCSKADLDRLGRWSRTMAVGKPRVALFQQFANLAQYAGAEKRHASLLRRLARVMLAQAADNPSSPMLPLFLELVKQMLDAAKFAGLPTSSQQFPQELGESLVRSQAFDDVHEHLIHLQPNTRPTPPSVAPIMAISTALLLRTATTESYPATLSAFTSKVLTIPQLVSSRRLPPNALNTITSSTSTFPLFDLLGQLSAADKGLHTIASHQYPHLLANMITLVRSRLLIQPTSSAPSNTTLKNGKELAVILDALRHCLEHIAPSSLAAEPAGRSASSAIDVSIDTDMAVDAAIPQASTSQPVSSAHSTLDGYTYSILEELVTEPLLSNIVAASTRFSGSSRPALSSFMVALLYSWPNKRETIVNTLVYSDLVAAGRGLIRELWRGWVRTSSLAKAISGSSSGTTSNLTSSTIAALDNPSYKAEWPHLILLAELYARTLLTLGDDEFHDKSGNALGAGRAAAQSTPSRNPLTVDEVIGLSALFRNIAFALYWQPEVLAKSTTGTPNYVVGTKLSLEHLRNLSTNLLQMIHARDSRKQFTPPNHWIMTSQMDLQSFIESAIVEDRALNEDEDSAMPGPGDESDDEDRPRTRAPVARRRNVPTRRQMAFVSPRLGVLNNIPFVIPFETRVSIFQQFVANDREKMGLSGVDRRINFGMDGRRIAGYGTIRRGHVADDGFRAFSGLGSHLKGRLAIRFMDEHGQEEAGIDGGGLFKEFLTSLCKEAFDIDRGLWAENRDHELYPTSTSYSREGHSLQWYAFLGRVLGKALYEGILVDVPFAPFFLSKWLGRASGFDDLASYDPELYQGLVQLKNYAGNVEKDLSLNFTVSEEDFGVSRTIDLIPNGSNVPVTNENRISYIYRVSDYRLNKQIEKQCGAFFSGLSDLVDPKWLRMFNQVELALLVGGAETGISVDDLRHNTVYPRGYDESHPSIQYFWKVVESFNQEDKKALVKFCTSCPRPPLLGFSQLTPKFSIASGGSDENRMPSASTCVNLLKLPTYSSPEQLKQKLLASIHSGAGFDLS